MHDNLITRHSSKEAGADALRAIKRTRRISNADLGDILGCSEATIRQRMDDGDNGDQLTLHEIRRMVQADGIERASLLFADLGIALVQTTS